MIFMGTEIREGGGGVRSLQLKAKITPYKIFGEIAQYDLFQLL